MSERKESIQTLYNLLAKEVLDKKHWDLPLVEKDAKLSMVLVVLSGTDHAWVVNSLGNKKLLGVLTEGDVLKALAPKRKITYFGLPTKEAMFWEFHETAEHIMSREPLRCKFEEKVKDLLDKMLTHRVSHIAVVDNSKIVGEVTLHNLIVLMKYFLPRAMAEKSEE